VTGTQNNKIWTIKLRPGIKFHDGTALDAQAVKDNLDHYRKDNLLFVFVFADITAVDVVDPLTVKVTSKVRGAPSRVPLGSSRLGMMAEAQMKSPDCNTKLIGTGPFEFVSWKFGDKFVAKRNRTTGTRPEDRTATAVPQQITFVPQEDGAKRTSSLEAGDSRRSNLGCAAGCEDPQGPRRRQAQGHESTSSPRSAMRCSTPRRRVPEPVHAVAVQPLVGAPGVRVRGRPEHVQPAAHDGIQQNASGPFAPGVDGYLADTGLVSFSPEKARPPPRRTSRRPART